MVSSVPRKALSRCFKLLVKGLRAADEAHAGQTVAPLLQGLPRCLDHRGMIGQAQIIVRAEV